jgi:Ice-binding-like
MNPQVAYKPMSAVVLAGLVSLILLTGLLINPSTAHAGGTPALPVNLGTAATYGVLGGGGVTSAGATNIYGDLGSGPGGLIVGMLWPDHDGTTHAGDAQAIKAQSDFAQAYSDAAGRTPSASFSGDQGGVTFDAGVYSAGAAIGLTGTMTLDGQNDPNAVFIFQVNAAVTTAANSTIHLINGAQASNVFWQVNGAVTTGAPSSFSGTIMASGAITLGAGASLDGGALADGLVTLAANTVTVPDVVTFISPTPTSALISTTTDTVSATGSYGDTGAITYASMTPSVCTVGSTSGALTYVTPGTCTVGATQAAYVTAADGPAAGETNVTVSVPATKPAAPTSPPAAAAMGYYLVGSDGGIFTFGGAQFYGSTGSLKLQRPVVGITATVNEGGYWLVASDGGIFSFGNAGFYGSIPGLGLAPADTVGGKHLNAPIVGMVPSFDGGGYFMVASDGGVFAFGDAAFEGSCPGIGGCGGAAVAVAPDASGRGYWLITATGNIYTFGNATYFGAPGPQNSPVTSMVRTTDGLGYWVLLANGVVFAYGDAVDRGSPVGSVAAPNAASAIFTTSDGGGYWVASANGQVFTYGDAPYDGGMSGTRLNGSIIAATGF